MQLQRSCRCRVGSTVSATNTNTRVSGFTTIINVRVDTNNIIIVNDIAIIYINNDVVIIINCNNNAVIIIAINNIAIKIIVSNNAATIIINKFTNSNNNNTSW